MTVLERQKLRQEIMQTFLDNAKVQASQAGRSLTCIRGMQAWGETAAGLHGACRGEEPGNGGCLCECHDDGRGGVISGTGTAAVDSTGPGAGDSP